MLGPVAGPSHGAGPSGYGRRPWKTQGGEPEGYGVGPSGWGARGSKCRVEGEVGLNGVRTARGRPSLEDVGVPLRILCRVPASLRVLDRRDVSNPMSLFSSFVWPPLSRGGINPTSGPAKRDMSGEGTTTVAGGGRRGGTPCGTPGRASLFRRRSRPLSSLQPRAGHQVFGTKYGPRVLGLLFRLLRRGEPCDLSRLCLGAQAGQGVSHAYAHRAEFPRRDPCDASPAPSTAPSLYCQRPHGSSGLFEHGTRAVLDVQRLSELTFY